MHEEEIKIEEPSLFPLLKTKSKKKAERESEETEK